MPEHEHDEILGRAYDRRLVGRLWATARPQARLILSTLGLFPLLAVVELAQPYLLKIAIDDLGAGNSGLRLLSQIHFDIVKIDLSLVQAGTQHEASLDIVRTLMELSTRWGAYAVAEGVETVDQLHMLRQIGLGHAQGYLLGRPTSEPSLRQIDLETILGEQGSSAILRALAAASV